jgi:hypothetical protein
MTDAPTTDGDDGMDAIRAEIAAVLAGEPGRTSWEFSRPKCALMALAMPPLTGIIVAAVILVPGLFGSRADIAPDAAVPAAVALGLGTFVAVGVWMYLEAGIVLVHGGGFTATPSGLTFRYGRDAWLLPWPEIGDIRVTTVTTTGRDSSAVEIRLLTGDHHWPFRSVLWGSKDDLLRVSTYVLGTPPDATAAGINAAWTAARTAAADHSDATDTGDDTADSRPGTSGTRTGA